MWSIVVIGLFCEVVNPTGLSGPFQNREKAFYVFSFKSSRYNFPLRARGATLKVGGGGGGLTSDSKWRGGGLKTLLPQ